MTSLVRTTKGSIESVVTSDSSSLQRRTVGSLGHLPLIYIDHSYLLGNRSSTLHMSLLSHLAGLGGVLGGLDAHQFFYKQLWYRFRNQTQTPYFSFIPSPSTRTADIAFWHLLQVLYLYFSFSTDTEALLHYLAQAPIQSQFSLQLTVIAMDVISRCQQ